MIWICFAIGLLFGGFLGSIFYCNIGKAKGVMVGIIVTLGIGLLFGGGFYLDVKMKDDKWNDGYCPECNVHWVPFGASDRSMGSKHKYYYCEECYREIEL